MALEIEHCPFLHPSHPVVEARYSQLGPPPKRFPDKCLQFTPQVNIQKRSSGSWNSQCLLLSLYIQHDLFM